MLAYDRSRKKREIIQEISAQREGEEEERKLEEKEERKK